MDIRRLRDEFNDERYSDVLLEFDDGGRTLLFHGIKRVLAAYSPYFETLFAWEGRSYHAHQDQQDEPIRIIIDPETGSLEDLQDLLEWMYRTRKLFPENSVGIAKMFAILPAYYLSQLNSDRLLFARADKGRQLSFRYTWTDYRQLDTNSIVLGLKESHKSDEDDYEDHYRDNYGGIRYLTSIEGRYILSTILIGHVSPSLTLEKNGDFRFKIIEFYQIISVPEYYSAETLHGIIDIIIVIRHHPYNILGDPYLRQNEFEGYMELLLKETGLNSHPYDFEINRDNRYVVFKTSGSSRSALKFIMANNYTSEDVRNFIVNNVYKGMIKIDFLIY